MSAIENVLSRLERVRRKHNGWIALCPAHEDRQPSLDIGVTDDGRVLLNCWRGCKTEQVLAELGLGWSDLFEDGNSPPTSPFIPKRTRRHSESSSRPLTRQEIEESWDAGLLSQAEYLRLLDLWNLKQPDSPPSRVEIEFNEHGEVTRYELRPTSVSPEGVTRDEADYLGPGDEPRQLRPPLTREDFPSDEVHRSYENWRQKSGSLR